MSGQNWKRNAAIFLGGQTISLFGSSLVQYAITWYITLKTQSGIMMTISIICGFLPVLFLSPFAGVWADRYNRKTIIILSDTLIAVSTLILAIFFYKGFGSLWLLFVVSGVRAIGTSFQTPAVGAFLPQIVPEDKLTKVNAVNGSIQSFVMLLSPMLSGALLSVSTIEMIFLIDVVTAAIAIFLLALFLHTPAHEKALEKQPISYFKDMKEGFSYIRQHEYVRKFFMFCAVFFVLATPVIFLTPIQIARTYGEEIWRLTAMEIVFSIGMIGGGVFMASWGGFKNRIHTMSLSGIVIGACTLMLGVVSNFWVYLFFMTLFGMVMPMFNIPSTVLLQEKVEENYLGRVFGVLSMISSVMMPLGMLVFGPLSDFVKIEWLLIVTGLFLFIQSFFLVRDKALLEAGKTDL